MKKKSFTPQQIATILKEYDNGKPDDKYIE